MALGAVMAKSEGVAGSSGITFKVTLVLLLTPRLSCAESPVSLGCVLSSQQRRSGVAGVEWE